MSTASSKVEIFEIEFDREPAVYREGDNITGKVNVTVNEELKFRTLRIELYGIALVKWDADGGDIQIDPDEKLKGDCNREQYFHKKISLLEKEGDISQKAEPLVLKEGTHTYYFECKLPPELPSSFEGQYGQIRYLAKAYIDRPSDIASKKSSIVTKKAFTVLSGLDLNFIPEAAAKIELCKYKDVGGWCCGTGSITIDWTVEKSGYVPGEDIIVNGAIQNESQETVAVSKVALNMVVDYTCRKRKKREKHQIAMVDKGETSPGDITVWVESLRIPPVPPTGLSRCRLIDINYELVFTATFVGKESPVNFTKDIYVGTVPMSRREMKSCIAGMYNQPYVESIENLADAPLKSKSQLSLTHIIAQAVTQGPTANPTAPCLATMERGDRGDTVHVSLTDTSFDRDPPFAPGHAGQRPDFLSETVPLVEQPAATNVAVQRPDILVPTLATSMFGAVDIRDAEDTPSVRGELSFAPKYPYFNNDTPTDSE